MAITLKQFDGSTVTPTDDAIMNQLIIGASGIIEGCVPTWLGSNQIKISAGRGIAMGRQFTVDEETVTVTLTGGSKGRLLVQVDTGNATPGSFVSQAASTLPGLTQQNINHGGTIFQVPICTYDVGALAISNMVDVRSLLVGPTVINHSASKITSGTLPLARGGTGATSAGGALTNIGAAAASHAHPYTDITGFSNMVELTVTTSGVTSATRLKAYKFNGFIIVRGASVKLSAELTPDSGRKIASISGAQMVSGMRGCGSSDMHKTVVVDARNTSDIYIKNTTANSTIATGDSIDFSLIAPMVI